MLGRKGKKEIAQAAEAYRWERDASIRRAEKAERKMDAMMDELVRVRKLDRDCNYRGQLALVIEISDLLIDYRPITDEYERLAHRIVMGLTGLSRDYRGDGRQSETQRVFGL